MILGPIGTRWLNKLLDILLLLSWLFHNYDKQDMDSAHLRGTILSIFVRAFLDVTLKTVSQKLPKKGFFNFYFRNIKQFALEPYLIRADRCK